MATPPPDIRILIVYYSRGGATRALAEQIAVGARGVTGVAAYLLEVGDRPVDERRGHERAHDTALRRAAVVNQLATSDALIVGAPALFGSMASPVKRLFEDCATAPDPPLTDRGRPWRLHLFRDKVGAAFTGSATPHGGNEQALHSVLTMLMHLGMLVVTPGQGLPVLVNQMAPYGATAITGAGGDHLPAAAEQAAARALGARVATITTWLHLGRWQWDRLPERKEKGCGST